jgi:hypothetical protein
MKRTTTKLIMLAVIVALNFSFQNRAKASDPETWKSLDKAIEESGKDIILMAYVSSRCAGLLFSLSKAFSGRADSKEMSEKLANKGTSLMVISAKINLKVGGEKSNNANIEKQIKLQSGTVVKMADSYTDRMETNHIKDGDFFGEDPFMKNEIKTCNQRHSMFIK